MDHTPHPVDLYVGQQIRKARTAVGISQTKLGEICGITFQQIQKYENAKNRCSASRLVTIARALGTSASHFLDDAPTDRLPDGPIEQDRGTLMAVRHMRSIKTPELRKAAVEGLRHLAHTDRYVRETVAAAVEGTELEQAGTTH